MPLQFDQIRLHGSLRYILDFPFDRIRLSTQDAEARLLAQNLAAADIASAWLQKKQ
jgi:hypothetical protein